MASVDCEKGADDQAIARASADMLKRWDERRATWRALLAEASSMRTENVLAALLARWEQELASAKVAGDLGSLGTFEGVIEDVSAVVEAIERAKASAGIAK